MVMKSYKHLNIQQEVNFNWQSSLLQKALPHRAFNNQLTGNIILSAQAILVKGFVTAKAIKTYLSF